MKILGPLILVGFFCFGIFVLANWSTLTTSATLSFVAFSFEAPLGLLLLGVILVFAAFFVAYVLILRTTMLMDAHRYARELKAQQQLAEKAEASRLNELRGQINHEFAQLRESTEKSRTSFSTQIEGVEEALRSLIEETSRSQLAYIGEVEDKLDRSLASPTLEK
ncbi:hypothetical protein [Candidatus Nitrotoga sp. M5]|uniref:hypothetical protein n=1 Tax=Candidatus Nitrotoga sp. M5 TaxID=2890409 RepID=UPI001EF3CF7F|nr:hypothetical protein [Candidatus Nitrotoga sp. M5]CAH1385270.1 conserved hypothetical protein [Candidatus Nitrotoga sp. M5]